MRIITKKSLISALFDHPYVNNPDYHAAMSVVYISPDNKLLIGYWHAPVGQVKLEYGMNVENIYLIEGAMSLQGEDGEIIKGNSGDLLQCGGQCERLECIIHENVKALFIVYPQTEDEIAFVRNMESTNAPLSLENLRMIQ